MPPISAPFRVSSAGTATWLLAAQQATVTVASEGYPQASEASGPGKIDDVYGEFEVVVSPHAHFQDAEQPTAGRRAAGPSRDQAQQKATSHDATATSPSKNTELAFAELASDEAAGECKCCEMLDYKYPGQDNNNNKKDKARYHCKDTEDKWRSLGFTDEEIKNENKCTNAGTVKSSWCPVRDGEDEFLGELHVDRCNCCTEHDKVYCQEKYHNNNKGDPILFTGGDWQLRQNCKNFDGHMDASKSSKSAQQLVADDLPKCDELVAPKKCAPGECCSYYGGMKYRCGPEGPDIAFADFEEQCLNGDGQTYDFLDTFPPSCS